MVLLKEMELALKDDFGNVVHSISKLSSQRQALW